MTISLPMIFIVFNFFPILKTFIGTHTLESNFFSFSSIPLDRIYTLDAIPFDVTSISIQSDYYKKDAVDA